MTPSISGGDIRPPGRAPAPWWLLAVAALVVGSFLFPGLLIAPLGAHPGTPVDTPVGFRPSGESPTCAQINSNATLNSTYTGIYEGVKNLSNSTVGPNGTRPVNQSGYPNIPTGEALLRSAWIAICGSPAYTTLLTEWGLTGLTSSVQLTSTGYYQIGYGFAYHASCANPADSSSNGCGYFTSWFVALPSGNVTGPVTTAMGPPLGNPPGSAPGPTSGGPGGQTSLFGAPATATDSWIIAVGAVAAVGALVALLVLRRPRSPNGPDDSGSGSHDSAAAPRTGESGTIPSGGSTIGGPSSTTVRSPASAVPPAMDDPLSDIY